MLTEGKARSQRRVCWRGVAQAGSPEGGWGGHWEMPGRTSRLPQPCQGTAWLHPPLETSSKAMATSPGGVTASLGDITLQPPQLGFPGDATLQGALRRGGGWWHGAHPGSGPGRVPGHQCPLHVATGGLVELLLAKPPLSRAGGAAGKGALAWAAFCPDHPVPCSVMGGTTPHSPLPLSAFQDRTMGSLAHPPTLAPSTMSEVTGPCCALCHGGWGGVEDAQHQAGPGHPSAKLGQLPTAGYLSLPQHPWGQQFGWLWVCTPCGCWRVWGGWMSGC